MPIDPRQRFVFVSAVLAKGHLHVGVSGCHGCLRVQREKGCLSSGEGLHPDSLPSPQTTFWVIFGNTSKPYLSFLVY